MLSKAGDQVPVIPLIEVVGKSDKVCPEQMGATALKVGIPFLILMFIMSVISFPQLLVAVKVNGIVAIALELTV